MNPAFIQTAATFWQLLPVWVLLRNIAWPNTAIGASILVILILNPLLIVLHGWHPRFLDRRPIGAMRDLTLGISWACANLVLPEPAGNTATFMTAATLLAIYGLRWLSITPFAFSAGFLATLLATEWLSQTSLDGPMLALLLVALLLAEGAECSTQRQRLHAQKQLHDLHQDLDHATAQLITSRRELKNNQEERSQLKADLLVAREMTEQANLAKTEFLATMSHEIRTPLNGILPILEMLNETQLTTEQAQHINTALNSSQHLIGIINDILDYSKIEAGRLELEQLEFNLKDLIVDIVALMKRASERRGLQLNYHIQPQLPARVQGDALRLRQVLINLLSNAIKFTEQGSVDLELQLERFERKQVCIRFAVKDTGIGIPAARIPMLFQHFNQADASTTRRYGGTGLGLVISQKIVRLMNGEISIHSQEGQGSVFSFCIPFRRSTSELPAARKHLHGARIIVVGFLETDAKPILEFMKSQQIECELTESVQDAFKKILTTAALGASWGYDLLLVNVQGIGFSITALIEQIEHQQALTHLAIIACQVPSGIDPEWLNRFDAIIEYPVQLSELKRALLQTLDVETAEAINMNQRYMILPDPEFGWSDQHKAPVTPAETSPQHSAIHCKILIVEDNMINLRVIQSLLKRYQVQHDHAPNGLEAVNKVKSRPYDLVFMDCQMPVMDGFQATQTIREYERAANRARLPIVAMTANAMPGDREKCLNAGMDDYIAKPVKTQILEQVLRHWVNNTEEPEASRMSAPETNPQAASWINQEILDELEALMGEDFRSILYDYLKITPDQIRAIHRAVSMQNADDLVMPAHSLKSSSANVGALEVSELAKRLEMMARNQQLDSVAAVYKQLLPVYQASARELKKMYQKGRGH